jgi:glycosyltransferase involved in cell wall biosynthesis
MPTYSKIASSATKMAEAWAMNLPVVTNTGWGDIDILVEKGFPIIVCNGEEGLEGAIKKLLEPVDNHLIRSKIEFFDLRRGISRLEEIYKRLSA